MNMEINPSEYKVLIVDDVISNVLLLKVLLTNEKFNIVTAGKWYTSLGTGKEGKTGSCTTGRHDARYQWI